MQLAAKDVATDQATPCPKCRAAMILAAITRHPVASQMQRYTFLCTTCNQTKTYVLPADRPLSAGGQHTPSRALGV